MTTTMPACRGKDTEIFYDFHRYPEARNICRECPIKLQCRMDFATDPYAFAGGMSPAERNAWVLRDRERRAQVRALEEAKGKDNPAPTSQRRVTPEQREQIFELFASDELYGPSYIGEKVGLAKSTVQRVCREAGLSRTPEQILIMSRRGGQSGGQRQTKEQNIIRVVALFAEGLTPKQVAREARLDQSTVYYLRKAAVKRGLMWSRKD